MLSCDSLPTPPYTVLRNRWKANESPHIFEAISSIAVTEPASPEKPEHPLPRRGRWTKGYLTPRARLHTRCDALDGDSKLWSSLHRRIAKLHVVGSTVWCCLNLGNQHIRWNTNFAVDIPLSVHIDFRSRLENVTHRVECDSLFLPCMGNVALRGANRQLHRIEILRGYMTKAISRLRMLSSRKTLLLAGAILFFRTDSGVAQNRTLGEISGTVTDSAGARIPNAQILLTNTLTSVNTETRANSDGVYDVNTLVPGTYTISVS